MFETSMTQLVEAFPEIKKARCYFDGIFCFWKSAVIMKHGVYVKTIGVLSHFKFLFALKRGPSHAV
jgi:hypothetical protein